MKGREMTELTTRTMTGQAADVLRALHNAALFASTDRTLPVLCHVHFRVIDGTQVAEATDRYAAGQAMIRSADPGNGTLDDVLLDARDLRKAIGAFRRVLRIDASNHVRGQATVTITHVSGSDHAELTLARPSRTPVTEKVAAWDSMQPWPAVTIDRNWAQERKRLARLDGRPWNRRHVFRRRMMALLAEVEGDSGSSWGDSVQLQFTTTGKPVFVTVGTDFRAMIMPVTE